MLNRIKGTEGLQKFITAKNKAAAEDEENNDITHCNGNYSGRNKI